LKKRLILHAGIHRTGTTSIQQALFYNADSLLRAGILYPKPMDGGDAINHQRLAWDIIEEKVTAQALLDWATLLAQTDAGTVILSAEDFCILKNLDFLNCFKNHFDVEVAIYLRRQDIWVNSWYNQHVKWPFDEKLARGTPQQFLGHLQEFHWLKYFDLVDRWSKAVGKDGLHIGVVEKGQIEDPRADLCDFCGINIVLENYATSRANESMPAGQINILRSLGMARYGPRIRNMIIAAAAKVPDAGDSNVYPRALRRMILDRYTVGNQMVAEQFLGRKDRILFRDRYFPDIASNASFRPDEDRLFCFARNLIEELCANSDGRVSAANAPVAIQRGNAE
jgi:hypothetical protein